MDTIHEAIIYFTSDNNLGGPFTFSYLNNFVLFNSQIPKQELGETWKEIWQLEEEKKLHRKYSLDFEKYYPDGKVEIHIEIK
ncbi:hypothetical protein [Peribacillus simplex]|uniref:hypothetical protein n=1 Tax=Peribacillus simplex TaxID=1478 RepID=UPI003D2C6FCE